MKFAMSKIKIHELAKKLNKASKEVMDIANKLGLDVKSHLNMIEDSEAKKIEKELLSNKKMEKNKATQKQEENKKEKSNQSPVIIRREVIISDEEEIARQEKQKQAREERLRKE